MVVVLFFFFFYYFFLFCFFVLWFSFFKEGFLICVLFGFVGLFFSLGYWLKGKVPRHFRNFRSLFFGFFCVLAFG